MVGIALIILLVFCIWNIPVSACAEQDSVFTNALEFYDQYGTGEIVFQNGNFYYGSRGRAGNADGIRYGVEGQKFTLLIENGQVYETGVALAYENHFGSCRRISYEKRNQYYYSLYQIRYDDLLNRFRKKYPQVDFTAIMYNHPVDFRIDFYLSIVKNGKASGYIDEKTDGSIEKSGTIYEDAETIRNAAGWTKATKEALSGYFGIFMHIYQPSVWYLEFNRNAVAAEGTMELQKFTWDQGQKICANQFSCDITVSFYINHPARQDNFDRTVSASFVGWSLDPGGPVRYKNQQTVKNLTDENEKRIPLYAVWEYPEFSFPMLEDRNYELVGWCSAALPVQKGSGNAEQTGEMKFFLPEERIKVTEDCSWYGVWKKKEYRIRFMEPVLETVQKEFIYTETEVLLIRSLMETCGIAGKKLNQELIRRGLA